MSVPRVLAIMGSGETAPTMAKVHRALFDRLGAGAAAAAIPAAIIDTPYGFQENADELSARAVEFFATSVGRPVGVASLRSRDVDPVTVATAIARVREARYVMAGPGSPSYALRHWAGGPIPDALAAKLAGGGILTMASAAALTVGVVTVPVYEVYKVGEEPRWLDGLDLLGAATGLRAAVVPHYDNAEGGSHDTRFCYMGERRLRVLEAALPVDAFILGVDSHTALVLDLDARTASVAGLGGVTIRVGGRNAVLPAGSEVAIEAIAETAREMARGGTAEMVRHGGGAGVNLETADAPTAPRRDAMTDLEGTFVEALTLGDTRAAVAALLDLDSAISSRVRTGEDSQDLDNAAATFRALIARLGERAEAGTRDPRAVLEPFVAALLELRARARLVRDWESADLVRDRLASSGVEVRDGPEGSSWVLADPAGSGVDSRTLVRQLEEKSLQLEVANRTLQEEVTERRRIADMQTSILDALPAHIALVDGDGRILAVNASWRRFASDNAAARPGFGVGTDYFAEIASAGSGACPDEVPGASDGLRRVLAGELEQFELEYPCHTPTEPRWFRLMITPLGGDSGSSAVVMHLDVTDRQLAQAALERSVAEQRELARHLAAERARLAEAQAVANLGSWETDLVHWEFSWSEETFRIFEVDPGSSSPTNSEFVEFIHPDDRERQDATFRASLASPGPHTCDYRIVMPDGRTKHLQERWLVTQDDDGRPIRAYGTTLDLTARVLAEESLRESEERFRQLAETISEVFWITDSARTRTVYVSPAYEAIWGRPVTELYQRPEAWLEAIHPDDRAQVVAALPLQETGEYDITYRIVRPDGAERWVRDRAFPVQDRDGAPSRIVGLAEDVTERKQIEAQFLRAQRMEALGTLAGGIAHDLNNVLTPIMMSIDLLREEDSPEGRSTTIDMIEASATKGAEMVRQVLAFARGVEGQRVEVDIADLVRDVAKIANDTFLKAIHVRTLVPADIPPAVGDPTQLHQVLLNLIVNSRDAMPLGGSLTITAALRRVDEAYAATYLGARPGEYLAISVADTGMGMTPDVQERIFEPFFTTKEHGGGTGLGLPTSLAIVRSHGGFFHVESTPGAGTVFVMCIPTGGVAQARVAARDAAPVPSGRGELILVVDDEPGVREITRRTLEANGYRVHLAADGAEAIEAFKARREEVAVVVTDLMMPVMDGRATIQALRELDPAVRIVTVSGLPPDSAPGTAPTRYLAKPYTTAELLHALDAELRSTD